MTEHELVITGSSDGYVRIYSMESINPKQEIKTFQGQVLAVLRSSSLVHRSLCEEQLLDLEQPKTISFRFHRLLYDKASGGDGSASLLHLLDEPTHLQL